MFRGRGEGGRNVGGRIVSRSRGSTVGLRRSPATATVPPLVVKFLFLVEGREKKNRCRIAIVTQDVTRMLLQIGWWSGKKQLLTVNYTVQRV